MIRRPTIIHKKLSGDSFANFIRVDVLENEKRYVKTLSTSKNAANFNKGVIAVTYIGTCCLLQACVPVKKQLQRYDLI